jgi:predicted unusual protein kinase regulating ubiquinone biosynthesis (AarF/ABC1/UbiB family)
MPEDSRLRRIGRLTGRVGRRMVGARVASLFSGEERRERLHREAFVDSARRVAGDLGHLKGAAMKLGQGLALAADSLDLPEDVRAQLSRLHDSAEPVPFADIRATVESALGAPLEDRFSRFDEAPLGTASLAQAHAAALPDGTEVVVKALHPGVRESVDVDLALVRTFARNIPGMRRRRRELDAALDLVAERLKEELDYDHEAANLHRFAALYADDPDVTVPGLHPGWSTETVLTLDRMRGMSFERFEAEGSPGARQRAGMLLARTFLEQVFVFRTLHADPHPGNVRFDPDGRIQLLDFGCVQRFDEYFVAHYAHIILGSLGGDRARVLRAMRDIGIWQGDSAGAGDLLWRYCQTIIVPFTRGRFTLGGPEDDLVDRVKSVGAGFVRYPEVQGPPPLVYLHRTLGGVYTLMRRLVVGADWVPLLRRYGEHAIAVAEGRVPGDPRRIA